jgi:predicted HicB family RNase H-like nuclease
LQVTKKPREPKGVKRPRRLSDVERLSGVRRRSDIVPKRDPELRQELDEAITLRPRIPQVHQAEVQGPREYPHRLTARVDPKLHLAVERYSEADRVSVPELVNKAIEEYLIAKEEKSGVPRTNHRVVLENPAEIIHFSRIIIAAIEETLGYSVERHHNRPPPALLINDPNEDYFRELRQLVAELKRLNENLELMAVAPAPKSKRPVTSPAAQKSALDVKTHLNTFLDRYAKALAPGAAVLTIGTVTALLIRLGVPLEAFTAILKSIKP